MRFHIWFLVVDCKNKNENKKPESSILDVTITLTNCKLLKLVLALTNIKKKAPAYRPGLRKTKEREIIS